MGVRAQFSIWWSNLIAWGYETISQYVGIFVWEFSLEFFVGFLCYCTLVFLCGTSCGGGVYMVPVAYDNGMVPR